MLRVCVIMGGVSEEREISLKTGNAVLNALNKKNYITKKIDSKDPDFIMQIKNFQPDVAFIALHGPYGEDGTMQGLLELLNITYCGCGVISSAIGMNKIFTKKLLKYENIYTADFDVIHITDYKKEKDQILSYLLSKYNFPIVIKPPSQGSSIGVYFAKNKSELANYIEEAFNYNDNVLIEKFLKGRELTVSVIGNENPIALPIIEIISSTGFYDFKAKYTKGLTEYIIPPKNLSEDMQTKIKNIALKTYKSLDCRGFARVDFILDNNTPNVLEINTIPGMTEVSLVPKAAKAEGISFEDLVDYFIKFANNENVTINTG